MSVPDLTASLTHTVHHMNSRWPACKEALFCCPPRGGELQGIVNLPLSSTWNFVTVRELVANGPGSKSSPCPCWPPIVWPQPLLPPGDFYQMGCVRRDAIKSPPSGKGLQIRLKLWTCHFRGFNLGRSHRPATQEAEQNVFDVEVAPRNKPDWRHWHYFQLLQKRERTAEMNLRFSLLRLASNLTSETVGALCRFFSERWCLSQPFYRFIVGRLQAAWKHSRSWKMDWETS